MVKNNNGGNKSKGLARKNFTKKDVALRVAREEGEIYAQAVKIMGGNIASAIDIEGNPLRVHIRGKFRGRGKHDNFISPNTWLLVGLHEWGTEKNNTNDIRDCDVLEVYNDTDKSRLKTSITSVNWRRFINNDTKIIGATEYDEKNNDIVFSDHIKEEYDILISSGNTKNIIINDDEEINIDDI
jgi:hypothetical protein